MEKILIVEDDQIVAENIGILLDDKGYITSVANNGADGLNAIDKSLPDLIICDINMPKMDGLELKKELNKSTTTFDIPFLFLTARTQISELRNGMLLGAEDYIFKPYNPDELIKIVKLRLEKKKHIEDKIKYNLIKRKRSYGADDTFLVKGQLKSKLIKILDIKLILAEAQYTKIVLSNNTIFVMRVSQNEWESKLPNEIFKRVHRATIINFNFVESHYSKENGFFIKLKNWDKDVSISRRKYKLLELKL